MLLGFLCSWDVCARLHIFVRECNIVRAQKSKYMRMVSSMYHKLCVCVFAWAYVCVSVYVFLCNRVRCHVCVCSCALANEWETIKYTRTLHGFQQPKEFDLFLLQRCYIFSIFCQQSQKWTVIFDTPNLLSEEKACHCKRTFSQTDNVNWLNFGFQNLQPSSKTFKQNRF